jgi:hypothetical protein
MSDADADAQVTPRPSLATVVREWGRIGCIGFGGPPTHIKLLRDLCVERKQWLQPVEFEDAIAPRRRRRRHRLGQLRARSTALSPNQHLPSEGCDQFRTQNP